ncbi:MAG: PD40 domain-containing protein [Verrucomicrobiales bacterium]|nr:PD40 domain-containing protein [Verrucomicrobiales bacterium]
MKTCTTWSLCLAMLLGAAGPSLSSEAPSGTAAAAEDESGLRAYLDAPMLFVKRHSYTGIHIYDTYYKWPPGGGGIYVLENPAAPRDQWRIRPVVDPTTPGTPGHGVYTNPELSFDATRLLFCFKGEPEGSTSIYEVRVDGSGLRRVTNPEPYCRTYQGRGGGQHDIAPAYLPDGRIVFLSTRPSGLVPCNNTGVAILHVMNADGSGIHAVSVNNVNEFDPSVLPDGRILFGRWEYIDKNALTIQSLWTIYPDGSNETALFANNLVYPEAILDARPVPGTPWVVGTFAKHNAPPRGSIAMLDMRRGKNDPEAVFNFEHPQAPLTDTGESCEPWPLNADVVLYSGRPPGRARNALLLIDRQGRRAEVMADPDICLHSPMLLKPQPVPPVLPMLTDRTATTGRFFVQDIYQGLDGVRRGEITHLRVIEETSRVSPIPPGGNPFNQVFLISAALGWSAKDYLGVVPVSPEGSVYFEAPSGRALYLQALDADGRLVQSMRTFVQAAPGTTRSCIGCHEHKATAPPDHNTLATLRGPPHQLRPESWGGGFLDYPRDVQPVLDRHCVRCHGGEEGFAAGLDLTGGWTEFFNISYENLVSRRRTQLVADLIAGIDCMNGTAFHSVQLFPPRGHGSGAAPLAKSLMGYASTLPRAERDLVMAWIDSNGIYHGSWDYTAHGQAAQGWTAARDALVAEMKTAGCLECHGTDGRLAFFENDWFNLQHPEWSRILRAPLAPGADGLGAGLCRDRKVEPRRQRIYLLRNGYAHAVQPVEAFAPQPFLPPDRSGPPMVRFASTADPHYQNMLRIIQSARETALAAPRVDLPGAQIIRGGFRQPSFAPVPVEAPATAQLAPAGDSAALGTAQ